MRKKIINYLLRVMGAQESAFDMSARRTGSSGGERADGPCDR